MSIEITDEFAAALRLLEEGSNLFLTGKAGTGKSTLIRHFMEQTQRRTVVAAPTGIAALNVAGYTLHRLFSFPVGVAFEDVRDGKVKPGRFSKTLAGIDTLVIDEVSMVRADLFDCVIASLERYGPEPGTPFGGVQVVLVGDLFQLPPVVVEGEAEFFETVYPTPYFFSGNLFDKTDFPTVNLTRVFRQIGDHKLVSMLNAIRDGRMSRSICDQLNRQTQPEFTPPMEEFWLTLATTNRIANARNRRALERLPNEEVTSVAEIAGQTKDFQAPTEFELTFKVGAQVMLVNNTQEWVNGSLGEIVRIDDSDPDELCVAVKLTDGSVVDVTPHTWEITRPESVGGRLQHEVIGSFRQLPFKLAWAITIHKSQGQTLDRAIIDLSGGTFATGQLYVALSRCTSLDGLVLTRNILPRHVKTDHRVQEFLADATDSYTTDYCALECLLVGFGDGHVRPIDIAVAFPNGEIIETLLNPTRDLGTAAADYGLTASDLQLAPTLTESWPQIQNAIAGRGLISAYPDSLVRIIDAEVKRTGMVAGLTPFAAPANFKPRNHKTARAQVEETLQALLTKGTTGRVHKYQPLDEPDSGYFLTRDLEIVPFGDPALVAELLKQKAVTCRLSPQSERAVVSFEKRYGVVVPRPEAEAEPAAAEILQTDTRVCFTGTVWVAGHSYSREEMEDLARANGLVPVANVTKTRCDALVASDPATQSGKARAAHKWGKPVLAAADFLIWAGIS